jgi:hypothetical protein
MSPADPAAMAGAFRAVAIQRFKNYKQQTLTDICGHLQLSGPQTRLASLLAAVRLHGNTSSVRKIVARLDLLAEGCGVPDRFRNKSKYSIDLPPTRATAELTPNWPTLQRAAIRSPFRNA